MLLWLLSVLVMAGCCVCWVLCLLDVHMPVLISVLRYIVRGMSAVVLIE